MGGSLKGADFTPLAPPVAERCAAVYLTGPAAEPISAAIEPTGVPTIRCANLRQAVNEAAQAARAGSTVLLAPACASFDAYRDYEARGDHFRELVHVIEASR
jgi:UDP-N-acetylmuramoylalanine--D-glutamate ligase